MSSVSNTDHHNTKFEPHDKSGIKEKLLQDADHHHQHRNRYNTKLVRAQVLVFALSYFSYCSIHFHREFWSMSKVSI